MQFKIKPEDIHRFYRVFEAGMKASSYSAIDVGMRKKCDQFSLEMTRKTPQMLGAELGKHYSNFKRYVKADSRDAANELSPYQLLSEYLRSHSFEAPYLFLKIPIESYFYRLMPVWLWTLVDVGEENSQQQALLPGLPMQFYSLKLPDKLWDDQQNTLRKLNERVKIINANHIEISHLPIASIESMVNEKYLFLLCAFAMFGYLCLVKSQVINTKIKLATFLYQASMMFLYQEDCIKNMVLLEHIVKYVIRAHISNLTFFQTRGRFHEILMTLYRILLEKNHC